MVILVIIKCEMQCVQYTWYKLSRVKMLYFVGVLSIEETPLAVSLLLVVVGGGMSCHSWNENCFCHLRLELSFTDSYDWYDTVNKFVYNCSEICMVSVHILLLFYRFPQECRHRIGTSSEIILFRLFQQHMKRYWFFLVYRIGESLDLLVHENLNFHIDAWTTSSLDVLLSNSAQGCNGKLSKSVENIK